MGRRILLAVLTLLAAATVSQAQGTGRIVGRVTTSEGDRPLLGATVIIVGTTRGAITDSAGRFTLADVPAGVKRVQARRIGYLSATIPVTVVSGQAVTALFSLVSSPVQLQEITTVGYGTQSTRAVTGAVATVTAEKLKDIPTNNAMKALQGRVPGVEIVTTSNEPGSPVQVRVRGVRSMSSGRNEPLYVVDGIPISGGIEDFNPQNIESVDVLKDASATAIYGSRGANGVILVTTKKGPVGGGMRSSFSLDSYYGQESPVKLMQMMNMQQFVKYLQDAASLAIPAQDTAIAKILAGNTTVPGTGISKRLYAYQHGIETDWQRAVLRDGLQRSLQGGVAGSSPDTRYSLSGNYFDQVGLIPGQGYTRGSAFASIDHTTDRLRVGMSVNTARVLRQIGEGAGAYGFAIAMTPFGSPYNYTNPDSVGILDTRPDDDALSINPLLEAQSMIREQTVNRVFGSAFAELQLMDGLSLRTNFGPDYTALTNGCYNNPWTHGPCSNPTANSANQGQAPQAGLFNTSDFAYTLDNLLQFNRNFASKHHIDATALYSIQHDRFNKDSLYATQLPYTTQLWYDLGSGTAGQNLSSISEWALQSYMGRVNYTLLDRYSLSITGRSDGSSRLAPGHKWAFFPSYGLAWQLGDEPFMRRFTFINQLKVRGSYGTTGNTSISPYQTQGTLSAKLYSFGGTQVRGYRPGSIPNPDLTWEKTDQTDVGAEFALWNNRVSGSVDGYVQNTRDLLLTRQLPVSSGFTSTLQNVGATKNTGFEVGISTVNLQNYRGVTWTSDINWSTNKNQIVSLQSGAVQDLANVWFVGQPINLSGDPQRRVFFDYQYAGIWQYADSIAMRAFNANGSTFKPGDPRVADITGDGKINVDDRVIVGTSYPTWTGSLSNRISYRGFDLSGLVTAKWHYTFIDGTPRGYQGRYGNIANMDYWTPTNPTNANPAPSTGDQSRQYASTRLYIDGSHWRIRNITAGYTFNEQLAGRIGAHSLRLYATAQDPYIHSDYAGVDPEIAGAAPSVRTLLLGTNINW